MIAAELYDAISESRGVGGGSITGCYESVFKMLRLVNFSSDTKYTRTFVYYREFENFKFTIIPYGETKNFNYVEKSLQ